MKVLIDTNGFLIPHQFGVDIFDELARLGYNECVVPKAVLCELQRLVRKARGEDRIAAKVGLSLAERCEVIGENETGLLDDIIVRLAVERKLAVCTSDAVLKKRLSTKNITVVYLRQTNRLSI
jgi:hypothetical protein